MNADIDIAGRAIRLLLKAGETPEIWEDKQEAVTGELWHDFPDMDLFTVGFNVLEQRLKLNTLFHGDRRALIELRRKALMRREGL